jgi:hypothetical protein
MFAIFDHPWGIVAIACVIFFVTVLVPALRARWWLWAVSPVLILAAFALDHFVVTDMEKIAAILNTASKAVETADCDAIGRLVADDYTDSYHLNKTVVMRFCSGTLSGPLVHKAITRLTSAEIDPDGSAAKVVFTSRIVFDEQTMFAQQYKPIALFEFEANLRKTPADDWLFERVEVLKMDTRPVSWRNLR